MHQLRIHEEGHPQIKNGAGGWKSPVVFGGKFFKSSTEVVNKLGVNSSTVSGAITRGGKVKGKEIRRATEKEIREHVDIESPTTYRVVDGAVEMLGPTSHWSKMVVYNNDELYKIPELADELDAHQSAIYKRIRDGGDDEVRSAKADDMPEEAIRVYPTQDGKPHKNKSRDAAVEREKKKKEDKKSGEQFVGVRWPNGSVDVRVPSGAQFMTRDKETDLPDEVRKLTRWM